MSLTLTRPGRSRPSAASSTISSRASGPGASGGRRLWGGSAAGTNRNSSSPSASRASRAEVRCPRWGGLKVPP